jgi:hypothetical protein
MGTKQGRGFEKKDLAFERAGDPKSGRKLLRGEERRGEKRTNEENEK